MAPTLPRSHSTTARPNAAGSTASTHPCSPRDSAVTGTCESRRTCSGSVGLGPDDALGARLSGERTGAGLAGSERDASHGDAELVLDLGLELGVAVEVRHREAAVDRRGVVGVLGRRRREPGVELVLRVDVARVLVAERDGALVERIVDALQRRGDAGDELAARDRLLVLGLLVAAAHEHGVLLDVLGADLEPDRHALLDRK